MNPVHGYLVPTGEVTEKGVTRFRWFDDLPKARTFGRAVVAPFAVKVYEVEIVGAVLKVTKEMQAKEQA